MAKKQDAALADLDSFIDRPEQGGAKRHMLSVDPDAYNFITETAVKLDTTRGRVVTALIAFFNAPEE